MATGSGKWTPANADSGWAVLGRLLSIPTYPVIIPWVVLSQCPATAANASWWRGGFLGLAGVLGGGAHLLAWRRFGTERPSSASHILAHLGVFLSVEHPFLWMAAVGHHLVEIFQVDRSTNRLVSGKLHGNKVIVIGNGPSAVTGEPLGHEIDQFNEVVRFNNFQTKSAGMDKWTGSKCTVHFSDGVLYPTYKEYHVPGATVVLSLIMDRFIIAGSYLILRMGADLQTRLTLAFLKDPAVGWIEKDRIDRLKAKLGLNPGKQPTSGMLAIDYFLEKEGVELPVYIHGFDFFMGPKLHYYDDYEPFYERINDRIGVNMHSPHKEKVYVEKLIQEGRVIFLKDRPRKS